MKITIRTFGKRSNPNQIENNGPSTITGTVCVTIRNGYSEVLNVLERSMPMEIRMANRVLISKPNKDSSRVTHECCNRTSMFSTSVRIILEGAGRMYSDTCAILTYISHAPTASANTSNGMTILRLFFFIFTSLNKTGTPKGVPINNQSI